MRYLLIILLLLVPRLALAHYQYYTCSDPSLIKQDVVIDFEIKANSNQVNPFRYASSYDARTVDTPNDRYIQMSLKGRTDSSGVVGFSISCDNKGTSDFIQNLTCRKDVEGSEYLLKGLAGLLAGGLFAYVLVKYAV